MATRNTGVAAAVRTIRMVIATINSTRVKPFRRTARGVGRWGCDGPDSRTLLLSAAKPQLKRLRGTALSLVLSGTDFAVNRLCWHWRTQARGDDRTWGCHQLDAAANERSQWPGSRWRERFAWPRSSLPPG